MRLVRNGVRYNVNGHPISREVLEIIGQEIFPAETWAAVKRSLKVNGYANCNLNPWGTLEPDVARKIAALEQRVAQLTLENIYLTA